MIAFTVCPRSPADAKACYTSGVTTQAFAIFDTAIGSCGIAWSERGVVAVQLPEATQAATRARVRRRVPHAVEASPPPLVADAITGIVTLLDGGVADLADVALDMASVPPFNRRVYEIARGIPPGSTLTYGEVAGRLGDPGAARAVGAALGENPIPIVVPCHRVLAAGGKMGGFSAPGGTATKRRLLTIEGALADVELPLFERG
jgi:methylated-DNA-[protein]-cysteine S-methyltransferase